MGGYSYTTLTAANQGPEGFSKIGNRRERVPDRGCYYFRQMSIHFYSSGRSIGNLIPTMYRTLLLPLLLLLSATSFGQTMAGTDPACRSRLGFTVTPLFMYLERTNETDDPDIDLVIDVLNDIEEVRPGYAFGLGFQFPLSGKLTLDAGIQYAQKSREIVVEGSFNWPDPNGQPMDPGITKITSIYNTHHLDLPVGVHINLGAKKLSWQAGVGITTSVFLDETYVQKIRYNNGDKDRDARKESYDYNTILFSPYAKLGLQYAMSDRMHIEFMPMIQYGLTPVIDSQPISARMWHAGVQVGCYFVCL